MATTNRRDPLRNFRFRVEIDGIAAASFSEVVIGAAHIQVIEYREGADPTYVRKLPGLTRFDNVTLKRGVTESLDLYNWFIEVARGDIANHRRRVVITVADETGADRTRFQAR